MWVLGGTTGLRQRDVWCSTDGANWTLVCDSAPWQARAHHCSVVFDNKIWLYGGSFSTDVWYTENGKDWVQATDNTGWGSRDNFETVVYNNKMWVMGGAGLNSSTLKFETYNDVWNSKDGVHWTQVFPSSPWKTRKDFSALSFNNKLWIMGGGHYLADGKTVELQGDVWSYKEQTGIRSNTIVIKNIKPIQISYIRGGQSIIIGFHIHKVSSMTIDIYNVQGRNIRRVLNRPMHSGTHAIEWNKTDNNGKQVSPGFYYLHIKSDQGDLLKQFLTVDN